jgi:hypothetical protein
MYKQKLKKWVKNGHPPECPETVTFNTLYVKWKNAKKDAG